MAEFLTTSAGIHYIEKIIQTAKTKVFLFSPYLKFSKTLFERLIDANRRGINVTIVYGKNELNPIEREKLFSLENLTLYFFENLHAKCYFNESNMVITSMNIYEFSEKNNREMGVLLNQEKDLAAFTSAYLEATSIIKNATQVDPIKPESKEGMGYCIRCRYELTKNTNKPLCLNCFRQWSKYKNNLYIERYCHFCGTETQSNMNKTLCQSCSNLSTINRILTEKV